MPSTLSSISLRVLLLTVTGLLCAGQAAADSPIESALNGLRGYTPQTVEAVTGLYRTRDLKPVWTTDAGPDEKAIAVIGRLERAALEGLRPEDYQISLPDDATEAALASFDVNLSAKVLRYVTDLHAGRVGPSKADPELFVFTRDIDGVAVLKRIADSTRPAATLAEFAPSGELYIRMRRLLAEQRALAASGGWQPVPDGPTLKPGMTDTRISAVRARLAASFDKTRPGNAGDLYDPELEVAVRQFQRRHGLTADGAIGAGTLKALNVPVSKRIETVLLNMERLRWMPDELGETHVLVNMAGFELDYVEQGLVALSMRVVVGKPFRMTPIFSDTIRYLELNPTWTATPKIASNDILPKLKKDPGYLVANGFEVFASWQDDSQPVDPASVDWMTFGPGKFPYRLRQKPGPLNALGQVKFMFPNEYDVYLHDTPSRDLFAKTVRAFSSGCIRLEKPIDLAALLLRPNGLDRERIDAILAEGKTSRINLKNRVPVHLTYLTAWIGEGGTVHFRDDIYDRDARLAKALNTSL